MEPPQRFVWRSIADPAQIRTLVFAEKHNVLCLPLNGESICGKYDANLIGKWLLIEGKMEHQDNFFLHCDCVHAIEKLSLVEVKRFALASEMRQKFCQRLDEQ